MEGPKISILIPTRSYENKLARCLNAVGAAQRKAPKLKTEVIVLDGGEFEDKTLEVMEKTTVRNLYQAPVESWWSYAQIMNYGASQSKGEYILTLDNDCYLDEDFLASISFNPKAIQGFLLYYHTDVAQSLGTCFLGNIPTNRGQNIQLKSLQLPDREFMASVSFSCALIPYKVWEDVGGMDEEYCWAYDDSDFCFRAWEANYQVIFNTNPKAEHEGGATMPIVRAAFPAAGHSTNSGKFYKKWTDERRDKLVKVINAARSKDRA